MAAKFFTGLPLDGPDPECVKGYGEAGLAALGSAPIPKPGADHSHRGPVRGQPAGAVPLMLLTRRPERTCDESPLAGMSSTETGPVG